MNVEDTARCQRAIELANAGQKQAAYEQFCAIHNHGNAEDVTLLYWIAYTTPSREEAQRAVETIAHVEPFHPRLQELHEYVHRMPQAVAYAPPPPPQGQMFAPPAVMYAAPPMVAVNLGPVLQCPYCHYVGPVRVAQKISTGGWICFGVLVLVFIPLCWIGLLIKKDYYACSVCGIALGETSY
jgi:hypothetical protein